MTFFALKPSLFLLNQEGCCFATAFLISTDPFLLTAKPRCEIDTHQSFCRAIPRFVPLRYELFPTKAYTNGIARYRLQWSEATYRSKSSDDTGTRDGHRHSPASTDGPWLRLMSRMPTIMMNRKGSSRSTTEVPSLISHSVMLKYSFVYEI